MRQRSTPAQLIKEQARDILERLNLISNFDDVDGHDRYAATEIALWCQANTEEVIRRQYEED